MHHLTRPRTALLACLLAGFALLATACGDDSGDAADDETTGGEAVVDETGETDAGTTGEETSGDDPAVDDSGESAADSADPAVREGRYAVGDAYTDGEFDAVYLGLARVPVGPDIFEGGACYAPLFDVTYLDPVDLGPDEFTPSVDAYLTDGQFGEKDQSGVGCDVSGLAAEGYERNFDLTLAAGETGRIFVSAFHVADPDPTAIDTVTLFGGDPETGLEPEVTLDLTS